MTAMSTRYGPPDDVTHEEAYATHPGFTIVCGKCGSTLVYVDTTLGFSSQSGAWGSVDLVCWTCKASVALVES